MKRLVLAGGGGERIGRVALLLATVIAASVLQRPAAAGSAGLAGGAAGHDLVVDRDGAQCPDAGYQSIQTAVDAAPEGSVVSVCPDLYTESVVVGKEVTLKARTAAAEGHLGDRCFGRSAADPPDPSRDVVVRGGSVAFDLRAEGIVVDGFVVEGNGTGIRATGASRYVIRRNLIRDNTAGVAPGGGASGPSVIRQNCFRDNTRTGAGPLGPIPGSAIVNLLAPQNVVIEHNRFFGNSFGVRLGGAVDVVIEHNRSLGDGTWLRMGGTRNLRIRHNRIGPGPSEAILFFPRGTTGAPNVDATVTHNVITGRGSDGIRAQAAAGSLLDSVVSHNRVSNNGRDAIRIEGGGNTGNLIEHNRLVASGEHDCHDDTAGPATAGTANLWRRNGASTESRPGLCVAPG